MPASNSYDELIERFISERLTAEEIPLFFSFLEEEAFRARYANRIDMDFLEAEWTGWLGKQQRDRLYGNIIRAGNIPVGNTDAPAIKRSPAKVRWLAAAAAAMLVLAMGVYYLLQPKPLTGVAETPATPVRDLPPGGNKAVLILGDKSVVSLDSLGNGASVVQGGMKIIKGADGNIRYVPAGANESSTGEAELENVVKTPRGGQYQLILADGTQVWLNAASSITFPARFAGHQRNVSITGEAYFEVAPDKDRPFIINIGPQNKVEVLGTHFNINAYNDEHAVTTTLLEGKVKVTEGNASLILRPGQQSLGAQMNGTVDVGQVMSWKNKVFSFDGKTLKQVLRELARWYDLTVVYEKDIPDIKLRGEMGMNLSLQQVIKGLADLEVNCRLEPGNRLVVLP
ncbi:iron dicitrate transport regulator FecR [Chitinophaga alhagiae]|uniref:Iron dicitrate transport regulator FecR n=1 Tax=Chitinophaga alhagiae TaxID=2203219 RepID=A0ABN5LNI8_9BACT|nr:FecR family protein [Chitinophaga alhagiae]AWO00669.1 iron dicitrate transport regulator FecR [Chitinophaga alhagiae]